METYRRGIGFLKRVKSLGVMGVGERTENTEFGGVTSLRCPVEKEGKLEPLERMKEVGLDADSKGDWVLGGRRWETGMAGWEWGAGSERAERSFLGKTRAIEGREEVKTIRRKFKRAV